MAKAALNLGHDAKAFPMDLSELKAAGSGPDGLHLVEYLRSEMFGEAEPWDAEFNERNLPDLLACLGG